jgi:hypothetical protein
MWYSLCSATPPPIGAEAGIAYRLPLAKAHNMLSELLPARIIAVRIDG